MRRWLFWFLLILAVFAIGWYYFFYHANTKTSAPQPTASSENTNTVQNMPQPAQITWQTVERPQEGIKLEMPTGAKDLEVPAYNLNGSSEQVEMLSANPDTETTFAVAWENDPPVARVNRRNPQRTLDAARDGLMERTQTFAITQSQVTVAGFPALDLTAKNSSGGILDARLIYANRRLYALIAAFPSVSARRQQDVERFYSSFTPAISGTGPKAPKAAS